MKHALLLLIFVSAGLFGQTTYKVYSDLQYDYATKKTNLKSTGKPFTGIEYTTRGYYSPHDTSQLRCFTNGVLDWVKTFQSKGVMQSYQVFYNKGLKNDSICMEKVSWQNNQYSNDTSAYEIAYINKQKQKMHRFVTYYPKYYYGTDKKATIHYIQHMQYYSYNDTRGWKDENLKDRKSFDSSGYHTSYVQQGPYIEYHVNGKLRSTGYYNSYEYRVKHNGQSPAYPNYGRSGSWRTYSDQGVLQREEVYRDNYRTVETTSYYPDGKLQYRYNALKLGRDVKLPSHDGITILPGDTFVVTQATYSQDGKMTAEYLRSPKGDNISCMYYVNEKPYTLQCRTAQNRPFGIWKTWDEKGNVVQFINYSSESNDTVCYKRVNGKILAVNLRDRNTTPLVWEQMPIDYYGNTSNVYLYKKTTMYKTFYVNGRIKSQTALKDGKRNGLHEEWDSLGAPTVRANFKNDIPDGQWNEWYPNGRPKKMFTYKNGIRDGSCTEYYGNGQLKWENIYANGVPGKPTAYSENGTQLNSTNYLNSFYPQNCIDAQMKGVGGIALHYFLADTVKSRKYVTLPDSAMKDYGLRMVAVLGAITKGHDYCAPITPSTNDNNEFDLYHSCILISKSLYTEKNKATMNAFFARNGIVIDRQKVSDNPVLGLETEYLVYYSSKQILNKQVVVDSLELYLAPNANDPKQGYLMSLDLNYPKGELLTGGGHETVTSGVGYCTISVEKTTAVAPYYRQEKSTSYYIVYDDLSSDYQYTAASSDSMQYWALN